MYTIIYYLSLIDNNIMDKLYITNKLFSILYLLYAIFINKTISNCNIINNTIKYNIKTIKIPKFLNKNKRITFHLVFIIIILMIFISFFIFLIFFYEHNI